MVDEVRGQVGWDGVDFVCFAATVPNPWRLPERKLEYFRTNLRERGGHIGVGGRSGLRQEKHGIGWRALGTH
jgi:hypothetical protein